MASNIETRVAELESLCEAMSALLLSHIAATGNLDENSLNETLEFAKGQSKAAKSAGNVNGAFYLDRFIEQLGSLQL